MNWYMPIIHSHKENMVECPHVSFLAQHVHSFRGWGVRDYIQKYETCARMHEHCPGTDETLHCERKTKPQANQNKHRNKEANENQTQRTKTKEDTAASRGEGKRRRREAESGRPSHPARAKPGAD